MLPRTQRLGKKIIVYEGGESSRFDEYAISQGIDGALRVMKFLKMREEAPKAEHENIVIKSSTWIRAKSSGIFLSEVEYGTYVKKGEVVGTLNDPFGEFTTKIKSLQNGYVIGLNHDPIVHQGDALMHIGVIK